MKLSNRIVTVSRTPIFLGKDAFSKFDGLVKSLHPSGIFVVVDQNTRKHCLPMLLEETTALVNLQVLETGTGEAAKSLENAEKLWNELFLTGASRSGLIINLGGGVISDLGGFVAAGYHRGINYVNVPTSLMGQADAAIGGKVAVNLGIVKNQVGFFYPAAAIFVFPEFLKTLPEDHLRSGLAEIIKCALISNGALWRRLQNKPVSMLLNQPADGALWNELVLAAISFKNKVVMKDFREHKLRKVLNFGHTLGHAIESLSLTSMHQPVLHGEAVAAGMICAAYLSHKKSGLAQADLKAITGYIFDGYRPIHFDSSFKAQLMDIITHDKKAENKQIKFTLIAKPGSPLVDVICDAGEISEAIDYYSNISQ